MNAVHSRLWSSSGGKSGFHALAEGTSLKWLRKGALVFTGPRTPPCKHRCFPSATEVHCSSENYYTDGIFCLWCCSCESKKRTIVGGDLRKLHNSQWKNELCSLWTHVCFVFMSLLLVAFGSLSCLVEAVKDCLPCLSEHDSFLTMYKVCGAHNKKPNHFKRGFVFWNPLCKEPFYK